MSIKNQTKNQIGIELYYYKEDEIKCDCMFMKSSSETQIPIVDLYEIVFFCNGRFNTVSHTLLEKKIKSVEFPFFTAYFQFTDTFQLTLTNSEV